MPVKKPLSYDERLNPSFPRPLVPPDERFFHFLKIPQGLYCKTVFRSDGHAFQAFGT